MAYMRDATGRRLDSFEVAPLPRFNEPSQFYLDATNRIGASTSAYIVLGTHPASGRMYLFKSGGGIVQSDDYAATFSSARTLPTGVTAGNVSSIVEFGGQVYLEATDGTSFGVWRAPQVAQGADWAGWSAKLISLPAGSGALSHVSLTRSCWGTGDVLLLATYGDPSGGPKLYRSTDGTTWNQVWSRTGIRHIHHVEADPYAPGHIVMTLGDGISDPIMHSTDYGTTWTSLAADSSWQGVQISFTPTDIWIAADSLRSNVAVFDRATLTPRRGSSNFIGNIAPPLSAGRRARSITDLATTAGTTTVTSATAAWTADDKGRYISAEGLLPPGTFITAVNSATSVTVNRTAIGSASGSLGTPTTYISGDTYFANAFFGLVDPATGIWYQIASDSSAAGQVYGVFYMAHKGGRLEILDAGGPNYPIARAAIIHGGYLWVGSNRYKLLSQLAA